MEHYQLHFPLSRIRQIYHNRIDFLFHAREEALAAHKLARAKMMERTMRKTKPFKVNDKVWLKSRNLKIPYQSRKLAPKREGPFPITEVLGPVTYRLTLLRQCNDHFYSFSFYDFLFFFLFLFLYFSFLMIMSAFHG